MNERLSNPVIDRPSPALVAATIITAQAVELMRAQYRLPLEELGVTQKVEVAISATDRREALLRSALTRTDKDVAILTATAFALLGDKVVTEEYDSIPDHLKHVLVEYGQDGWYVDPVDGTQNYADSLEEPDPNLRNSNAMFSSGRVRNGQPDIGIVAAPYIHGYDTFFYGAEAGKGAFKCLGDNIMPLVIDTSAHTGKSALFVSETHHPHIDYLAQFYDLIPLGGFVFKLCGMLDRDLVDAFMPGLVPEGVPIVGFVSNSASAHDYAAGAVIARQARAIVTTLDGSQTLNMRKGRHGLIVADNEQTHENILRAMAYERRLRARR